jgi:hypothetical protein
MRHFWINRKKRALISLMSWMSPLSPMQATSRLFASCSLPFEAFLVRSKTPSRRIKRFSTRSTQSLLRRAVFLEHQLRMNGLIQSISSIYSSRCLRETFPWMSIRSQNRFVCSRKTLLRSSIRCPWMDRHPVALFRSIPCGTSRWMPRKRWLLSWIIWKSTITRHLWSLMQQRTSVSLAQLSNLSSSSTWLVRTRLTSSRSLRQVWLPTNYTIMNR